MPKPLFLKRPSGLFVRFRLPGPAVGPSRYLVRSLRGLRGDAARLVAARMGYALSTAFEQGEAANKAALEAMTDDILRKALAAAQSGQIRKWEIDPASGKISANGKADTDDLSRFLKENNIVLGGFSPARPSAAELVKPRSTLMLRGAVENYFKECRRRGLAPATMTEAENTLSLFCEVIENKPTAELTQEDLNAFYDVLDRWPPRVRVRGDSKGLTVAQILAKADRARRKGSAMPTLNIRTQDKHRDRLRAFLNSLPKSGNPDLVIPHLQKKEAREEKTRRGFTQSELAKVFDSELRARHCDDLNPLFTWVPLLALYTGARLRDIAQVRVIDVEKRHDFWGMNITKKAGRLKNPGTKRFVVFAQPFLDLGFLDYVETVKAEGFERLFPDGSWQAKNGPGDRVSKWFNRTYMEEAGLNDPDLVFHSFRHTFTNAADSQGLTENQIATITGHRKSGSVLATVYLANKDLGEQFENVNRAALSLPIPKQTPRRDFAWSGIRARARLEERKAKEREKKELGESERE